LNSFYYAISGACIDNVLIEVECPEIPPWMGKRAPFYDALIEASRAD
jgi:UDP-3-O-acyl-N-acetylglucosamine deacetylase